MEITVEIKNVYGREMIYPACEKAERLARLTGNKTLTRYDIDNIKALGFVIKVKTPTL